MEQLCGFNHDDNLIIDTLLGDDGLKLKAVLFIYNFWFSKSKSYLADHSEDHWNNCNTKDLSFGKNFNLGRNWKFGKNLNSNKIWNLEKD